MPDAEYIKEYRENHPNYVKRQKALNRAKGKADRMLRSRHKLEWEDIYRFYLKQEGIING